MSIDKKVRARVEELIAQGEIIGAASLDSQGDRDSNGWVASALSILAVIFPSPNAPHRQRAEFAATPGGWMILSTQKITSILKATLTDLDAGVLTSIAGAARAEVFDDLLDHAEHYLKAQRIAPAGVVAGVVFEDTIRKACDRLAIPQKGVDLDRLISQLATDGHINALKAKRARAAAGLRTSATHAQWDEFGKSDVEAAIALTRELAELLLS